MDRWALILGFGLILVVLFSTVQGELIWDQLWGIVPNQDVTNAEVKAMQQNLAKIGSSKGQEGNAALGGSTLPYSPGLSGIAKYAK